MYRFNDHITQGKKMLSNILIFVDVVFNFSAEIGVFRLTFRVTLLSRFNLKALLPCTCDGKKCQIVSLTNFHQYEVFFIITYFDELEYSVQERVKNAHYTLICQNNKY